MKVLFIYADSFGYTPVSKTLEEVQDVETATINYLNAQIAFIQVEKEDENDRLSYVETKLVKNLKWVVRKNGTNLIILHSFAHLSESKASPEISMEVLNNTEERLANSGFEVYQTPFGYFLDLDIKAPGFSLARVFKSF